MVEASTPWSNRRRAFKEKMTKRTLNVVDLGLMDYYKAYQLQKEVLSQRKLGLAEDTLIILQHLPVITCGRRGKVEDLLVDGKNLAKKEVPFYPTDRGGGLTYHGPGQLVAYPILDLKKHAKDIHLYLRKLEEAVINLLAGYGVIGYRRDGFTGVWVENKKICSIGIGISRWVTYHGLSLNVSPDNIEGFSMIRPCGLVSDVMTSLSEVLDEPPDLEDTKVDFIGAFGEVFEMEPAYVSSFSALA